jgi:DNA-binding beta-propeller fold protein YncE
MRHLAVKFFLVSLLAAVLMGFTQQSKVALPIEQTLGGLLQQPVFQCGSGVDRVTEDGLPGSVRLFESGPVRPVVTSADGQRLYVTNTLAHCLEIYAIDGDQLRLASSLSVGLEPVAVAERNANEVWVVNHLSDSVSVVRLDGTPRVLRTLQVGDEPRDIVFAGANRDRAFITAAYRGQHRPGLNSSTLMSPGQGRADVWVFDAGQLDDSLTGNPLAIVNLFADTPRALAVSKDGGKVYAAAHFSGNQTTTLHRNAVINKKPGPVVALDGTLAPDTGLIVKYDGKAWLDEAKTDWSTSVKFSLPDYDVFAINANASLPNVSSQVSGVGTTLFNIAVHPVSGQLAVSNTEAKNEIRFEGPGTQYSTVSGRIAESRVSLVDVPTKKVDAVHLNKHINFAANTNSADKAKSLSQPTAVLYSPSGDTLYVAALGSSKVAALPSASLSTTDFSPNATHHISVPDGPAGLALNASGSRLYVYSHLAHSVSIVDTASKQVLFNKPLFSPLSERIKVGRRLMYDANATSSNGTVACASCHIFSDLDHLAWDLGNPNGAGVTNNNRYISNSPKTTPRFHPMKGPMTTQTLRGMAKNGPTHWRGDRTGFTQQTVRGALESIEEASFKLFNPAFVELLGRDKKLAEAEIQSLTDFVMALTMPPNPVRALDNSLSATEQAGRDIYFNNNGITLLGSCNHCHVVNPAAGQFGTSGLMTFEGFRITENFKVPHLRNAYQKLGMFGFSIDSTPPTGQQIRGFGYSNDGGVDTLSNFLSDPVFNFPAPAATTRAQVAAFTLAMDTDLMPIVGQQITWRPSSPDAINSRFTLLKQQAGAKACDLIVRGTQNGVETSGLWQADGGWLLRGGIVKTDAALKALATDSQPLTFTCTPPGSGKRLALTGGVAPNNAVIEFYHAGLDNYFITAEAAEANAIDGGAAGPGWMRTDEWFKQGGNTPVCRFYGSLKPGPNSHFYTADPAECASLKAAQASTPSGQPRWNFESLDFTTTLPAMGACPANTTPIYRAYNNGPKRGVDSNHRLSSNLAAIQSMTAKGWLSEGLVMCGAL